MESEQKVHIIWRSGRRGISRDHAHYGKWWLFQKVFIFSAWKGV